MLLKDRYMCLQEEWKLYVTCPAGQEPDWSICPLNLYFFSILENWDIRDGNLKKQAHLLRKAELKRRGITRYDAEILLAQGLELPEPKVVLERKIPANMTKNHTVNINEFQGRQRLSPRKHLSSQSLLSMPVQPALRTRHSPKKHLKNLANSFNQSFPTSIDNKPLEKGGFGLNGVTKQLSEAVITQSDSGLRHSPRLQYKTTVASVQVKEEIDSSPCSQPDQNLKTVADVNSVSGDDGRNIFSKLQFEVDGLQGLSVETQNLNEIKEIKRLDIQGCHNSQETEKKGETTRTPEMPLLTPFDSEPPSCCGGEGLAENESPTQCIPPLEPSPSITIDSSSQASNKVTSSGKRKRALLSDGTEVSKQLRKSPRKKMSRVGSPYKITESVEKPVDISETNFSLENDQTLPGNQRKRLRSNSGQPAVASSSIVEGVNNKLSLFSDLKSTAKSDSSDLTVDFKSENSESPLTTKRHSKVKVSRTDSVVSFEQDAGPTLRTRSHSKDNSQAVLTSSGPRKCDTNVFDRLNSAECAADGGVSIKQETKSGTEHASHYANVNIFESLSKRLTSSDSKITPQNGHIGRKSSKSRKRRLSFGGIIKSPIYRESSHKKKKFSLDGETPKRTTSTRNIFSDLSPTKIPRITIKMPRDPVLVKELANQHSDGVQFKLESPQPSVHGTPDNSDSSDSDKEESPLNCTKFRPARQINPGGFSMNTSQFYSSNGNCPKLMRIKVGDSHIDIKIPQYNDRAWSGL